MFTKIPTTKLAKRAAAATVICGTLALGTGGVAFAATPAAVSGSTPAAAGHPTCARAPKALARITKVESAVATRVPKLQAREKTLTAAGHTKLASRVEKRIGRLQRVDTRVAHLATRIEAKCPSTKVG